MYAKVWGKEPLSIETQENGLNRFMDYDVTMAAEPSGEYEN